MNTIDREWASKIVEGHEKMINERLKNLFWRAIIGSTFLAIACMIMGLTTLILLNGYDKVHQYLHYVKYESSRSMFIPSILAAIGFVFIIIIDRVNERANELETKKYTIRLLITILFIFCLFLLIFNIIIISIPYPNILSMSSFFKIGLLLILLIIIYWQFNSYQYSLIWWTYKSFMHYNRYVKYEDKMYMIDRIFMEGSDFVLLLREFKKDGNRRILEWVIGNNNRGNPKGQQIDRLHKHIHLPIVGCINFSDYALVTAELTYLSIENDTWFSTIQTLIIHAKKIIIELPENGKFGIENEITHEQVIVALSEQYGLIENQKGFYLELATIFNNPTFASKSLLVKYVKRQVFWKDFTNLQLLSDSEVITFLNS